MYFVSIPATGKPACCATFPNGQQENKPNGATLSISVILLQDILALRTRVPLRRHPALWSSRICKSSNILHLKVRGSKSPAIPPTLTRPEPRRQLLVIKHATISILQQV